MSFSFLELPDDILFNVIKFLQVPDILAARKTCKRLQAITMSRNVWTTMYKMSRSNNGFVPRVLSLVSQTIPDLERLLWRAHRVDTLWEIGASYHCLSKEIWSVEAVLGSFFGNVNIYQSRYLIIQTSPSITIYDIETKHEVFRQETEWNERFDRIQSHVMNEDADFWIPFRARSSSEKTMSILKMNALGIVTVTYDCPVLRQFFDGVLIIGNEFAIVNSAFIVHLVSQKVYPLSSVDRPELVLSRTVTFVSGGYVLVYSDQPNGDIQFKLYRLPDHTVVRAGTPVHPTQQGTLKGSVRISTAFLSSDISSSGYSGSIWMFFRPSNFGLLHSLRIVLQLDGHLLFHLTTSDQCRQMRNTRWTHLADGRTRVITQEVISRAGQAWKWVLYDVSVDSNGDSSIRRSKVDIPVHGFFDVLALDASRGILAVVPHPSYSEISILDLDSTTLTDASSPRFIRAFCK
ncbi:hypothetical protein BDP27DRAFT_560123 [Rhodocollybia butyracea]|uniref:F-box domain-containing protein n=1 Tax=Rhodocollybia butyracea TaxID=206335 RepID=A0A9P5PYQ3_9AGAR|nr:hypothetical protein BDP27DRAFT_560123 [Rhodocollybia butyracea]